MLVTFSMRWLTTLALLWIATATLVKRDVPFSLLDEEDVEFLQNFDRYQREWDEEQARLRRLKQQQITLNGLSPSRSPSFAPSMAPTKVPSTTLAPPNCISDESEIVYAMDQVSFDGTFSICLANIPDPLTIPVVLNGSVEGIMDVGTNIQLNNLHVVDAVSGAVTIDFYLRLYWRDNRFNMPLFWEKTSPYIRKEGYYLTHLLESDDLPIWLPDIRFHDASSIEVLAQTLRVNSSNVFFWSRHIVLELMQPELQFFDYPTDEQTLLIRYGSYAFNQDIFKLYFVPSAISYNQNYDGSYTFLSNPLWVHDRDSAKASFYVSSSGFKNAIFELPVKRVSNGVMLRLVLPITILTVLGGFTFWSDPGARFDSTVTLLLAVSALYIVILGNIPMLGYLTAIDKYCFVMFVLLAVAALMHQGYITLIGEGKVDDWDKKKIEEAIDERKDDKLAEEKKQREIENKTEDGTLVDRQTSGEIIAGEEQGAWLEVPTTTHSFDGSINKGDHEEDEEEDDDYAPEDLIELYPLRQLTLIVLETMGKILVFPVAVITMMILLGDGFTRGVIAIIWLITLITMILIALTEIKCCLTGLRKCVKNLQVKQDRIPKLFTEQEGKILQWLLQWSLLAQSGKSMKVSKSNSDSSKNSNKGNKINKNKHY